MQISQLVSCIIQQGSVWTSWLDSKRKGRKVPSIKGFVLFSAGSQTRLSLNVAWWWDCLCFQDGGSYQNSAGECHPPAGGGAAGETGKEKEQWERWGSSLRLVSWSVNVWAGPAAGFQHLASPSAVTHESGSRSFTHILWELITTLTTCRSPQQPMIASARRYAAEIQKLSPQSAEGFDTVSATFSC